MQSTPALNGCKAVAICSAEAICSVGIKFAYWLLQTYLFPVWCAEGTPLCGMGWECLHRLKFPASELDLPSQTQLTLAGWGRLQLCQFGHFSITTEVVDNSHHHSGSRLSSAGHRRIKVNFYHSQLRTDISETENSID